MSTLLGSFTVTGVDFYPGHGTTLYGNYEGDDANAATHIHVTSGPQEGTTASINWIMHYEEWDWFEVNVDGDFTDSDGETIDVWDGEPSYGPKVETDDPSQITHNSFQANGEVVDMDGEASVDVLFRWRKWEWDEEDEEWGWSNWTETDDEELTEAGTFDLVIDELKVDWLYQVKAVVQWGEEEDEGEIKTLHTTTAPGELLVDDFYRWGKWRKESSGVELFQNGIKTGTLRYTDFDEYEWGDEEELHDWTFFGRPDNADFVAYEDDSGISEQVLRRTPAGGASSHENAISIMRFDGQNQKDVDVIASFLNKDPNGVNRQWNGIILRGRETDDFDGYVVEISRRGGNESIVVSRVVNGTYDALLSDGDFDIHTEALGNYDTDHWNYVRAQAIGDQLRVKWWRDDASEPAEWGFTYTDEDELDAGYVGVIVTGNRRTDIDARWDEFWARMDEGEWLSGLWETGMGEALGIGSLTVGVDKENANASAKIRVGVDTDDDGDVDEWSEWVGLADGVNVLGASDFNISKGYAYQVEFDVEIDGDDYDSSPTIEFFQMVAELDAFTISSAFCQPVAAPVGASGKASVSPADGALQSRAGSFEMTAASGITAGSGAVVPKGAPVGSQHRAVLTPGGGRVSVKGQSPAVSSVTYQLTPQGAVVPSVGGAFTMAANLSCSFTSGFAVPYGSSAGVLLVSIFFSSAVSRVTGDSVDAATKYIAEAVSAAVEPRADVITTQSHHSVSPGAGRVDVRGGTAEPTVTASVEIAPGLSRVIGAPAQGVSSAGVSLSSGKVAIVGESPEQPVTTTKAQMSGGYVLPRGGLVEITGTVARIDWGSGKVSPVGTFVAASPTRALIDAVLSGRYRIAGEGVAGLLLYRGIDEPPDLDAPPWHIADALPISTPSLDPAPEGETVTYHLLLRRRNAWGLSSLNRDTWLITLDENGEVVTRAPSAPHQVRVVAVADGRISIQAEYIVSQDTAQRRATQWAIYLAEGVDPDPDVQSPVLEPLSDAGDGMADLDYQTSAYADGTVVHVLVRTRNAGAESDNTDVRIATADISGPPAVTLPGLHYDTTYTQSQGGS